jgi:predicted Zn-dependent protease
MNTPSVPRVAAIFLLGCSVAAAAVPAEDHFAEAQRAHYASLCRARKSLDSCSDAVRWSPGDPSLVATLADTLVRAGRLEEAIRDYRRAQALDPPMRGLDARINAAQAKLAANRRAHRAPTLARAPIAQTPKHYSNADPEAQSH